MSHFLVAVIGLLPCCPQLVTFVRADPDEQQSDTGRLATAGPKDRTHELPSDKRHTLWIPGECRSASKTIDVLVDFHGHPPRVRSSVRRAGLDCVVISVTYGGLSSVYRRPFSEDRRLFATLLDEALAALRAEPDFPDDAMWGRLAVSSFSAGFGAVREILKSDEYYQRIDGILMLDSLYCGYVGDGTNSLQEGVVHPGLMRDFVRFAQAAAAGDKTMIVTHCLLPTTGYASTGETADYLLRQLDLKPQPVDTVVALPAATSEAAPLRLYRTAVRKEFSLDGSPGTDAAEHVAHLQHMAYWLPKLPLTRRTAAVMPSP